MPETSTRDIIRAHQRRLMVLEEQRAQQGSHTQPAIITEINEIYRELTRLMVRDISVQKEQQPPRLRGLILLVGTGQSKKGPLDQSALDAINYHQRTLDYCWLIGSGGETGSHEAVDALLAECRHRDITASAHYVDDPFSVQESYALVTRLYAEDIRATELREDEVIADLTGATKPMSFGMLLACGASRPTQYMVRQPEAPSTPMMLRYTLGEDQA
jgi:hypothetical protein